MATKKELDLYNKGFDLFQKRFELETCNVVWDRRMYPNEYHERYDELLAQTAWNALYNGMYGIKDPAEAYFVVCEYYEGTKSEYFFMEMEEEGLI